MSGNEAVPMSTLQSGYWKRACRSVLLIPLPTLAVYVLFAVLVPAMICVSDTKQESSRNRNEKI